MTSTRRSKQAVFYVNEAEDKIRARLARSRGVSESDLMRRLLREEDARSSASSMTPGEYAVGLMRARMTGGLPAVAEYEKTHARALQHQVTGDNAGVIPTPIVDDLVAFVVESRPDVSASRRFNGPKPMPAGGKTFQLGRVTQRTTVANQAAEGDLLSSQKLTVVADTVTKKTYGGTLSVSEQDIDWTDGGDGGGALDDIYEDLAANYAEQTEAVTTAAVEAAATTTVVSAPTATSDVFNAKLAEAAALVLSNAKVVPDAILCAPDRWQYALALTDANKAVVYVDGRPLTLPLVVSPAHSAGFIAVAATKFVKTWEDLKGAIAVPAPSSLELTVAYRGYFTAKVYSQGLCALAAS